MTTEDTQDTQAHTHWHGWRPGPVLAQYVPPMRADGVKAIPPSILLVCRCGEVRRVGYPETVEPRD